MTAQDFLCKALWNALRSLRGNRRCWTAKSFAPQESPLLCSRFISRAAAFCRAIVGRILFNWPILLLLVFIGLQLVPLPASLLEVFSPRRAALLRSLQGVSAGIHAAPISVFPPGTLAHLLRVASYVAVLVLVRELAWRTLRRRWVVVFPIMVIAGAQAALGVFQFDWLTPVSPAHGTYLTGNHFAGLLELSLPFAVVYPIFTITTRRESLGNALLTSGAVALAALILLAI